MTKNGKKKTVKTKEINKFYNSCELNSLERHQVKIDDKNRVVCENTGVCGKRRNGQYYNYD